MGSRGYGNEEGQDRARTCRREEAITWRDNAPRESARREAGSRDEADLLGARLRHRGRSTPRRHAPERLGVESGAASPRDEAGTADQDDTGRDQARHLRVEEAQMSK